MRSSVTSLNRYRHGGSVAGASMGCTSAMPTIVLALQAKPAAKKAWDFSHITGITPRPLVSQGRSTG